MGPGSCRDSLLIKGRRISDWRVIGPKQDICVKGSGPSRKGGCTEGGRAEAVRECHKGVFGTQHSCCKQKLIASVSTCIRITQGWAFSLQLMRLQFSLKDRGSLIVAGGGVSFSLVIQPVSSCPCSSNHVPPKFMKMIIVCSVEHTYTHHTHTNTHTNTYTHVHTHTHTQTQTHRSTHTYHKGGLIGKKKGFI